MNLLANVPQVFYEVVLPIFVIIGIGFLLDRAFNLDLPTLSRLNFYVFVPALAFASLLKATMPGGDMLRVAALALTHLVLLYLLCCLLLFRGKMRNSRTVLSLGAIFFNCGNYGFPLVVLGFGEDYREIAAVILMIQNLLSFTFGIWLFERDSRSVGKILLGLLRIPVIYAVGLPFLMRGMNWTLPEPLAKPVDYLSNGLIPVALLTLGAQLSRSLGARNFVPISVVALLRLVVSPVLAGVLLYLPFFSQTDGTATGVLVTMFGLPVAVNVYILASQYKKDEELASQSVFWTTLMSAVTVSILLAIYR